MVTLPVFAAKIFALINALLAEILSSYTSVPRHGVVAKGPSEHARSLHSSSTTASGRVTGPTRRKKSNSRIAYT